MKIFLFLSAFFISTFLFSQSVNLGTTHFRNDRYLISFDKILNSDYSLQIKNLTKREFLLGQLIVDTLYAGEWFCESDYSNNVYSYFGEFYAGYPSEFPCLMEVDYDCFDFSFEIKISDNKVSSESYSLNNDFEVYSSSSVPIKRMNNEKKVEVLKVESSIDYKTNKIENKEILIESRDLRKNEIYDVDGNIYETTTIGTQTWMSENLRTTKFSNGVDIPMFSKSQWATSTAPGIISQSPKGTYYNFYTLESDDNVCPQGYHVPNKRDIAILYNEITMYGDHLKISGSNVKKRVYSPILAPVVVPVLSVVHMGWWASAIAVDAGLIAVSAVADAALFSFTTAVSPIFGWKTKKHLYYKNLKKARKYKYINQRGEPLRNIGDNEYTVFEVVSNIQPVDTSEWSKFKIIMTDASELEGEAEGELIEDKAVIDSLKSKHKQYEFKLKFKPFNLPGSDILWSNTTALLNSDFFQEWNGLIGSFNIMPYRRVSENDYPIQKYQSGRFNKYDWQPVLTLLLNKGNNEYADQFGFNLSFDNGISFPDDKRYKSKYFDSRQLEESTGISYWDGWGYPAFFAIHKRNPNVHELNTLRIEHYSKTDPNDFLRMQTRVRCVKD